MTQRIVLASANEGKIAEIQTILQQHAIEAIPQSAFDVLDVAETGMTFIENAIIKARHAASITKLPAIADDSGLEVDALGGSPGVYSARYAGLPSNDKNNTDKLLRALATIPTEQRSARFHCTMVFMAHANDPSPLIGHGVWDGRITLERFGDKGFGYDPVFYVPEHNCTSAQLDQSFKNSISHRAQALQTLMPQIARFYTHKT